MFRNRKLQGPRANSGQSTVEYIVLVTAVIAVVILFMNNGGTFRQKINNVYDETTNGIVSRADFIANTWASNVQGAGEAPNTGLSFDPTQNILANQ